MSSFVFGAVSTGENQSFQEFSDPEQTVHEWKAHEGSRLVMLLDQPDEAGVQRLVDAFGLPELAVEDTMHGHQRPKLERYDDALFVVLHNVAYTDASEKLTVGEVHVFVGEDYFIGIGHHGADVKAATAQMRRSFRKDHLDPRNPHCQLYFLFDAVVDQYEPILVQLDEDLDEIEEELFAGGGTSQRIYELFNEVVKFQRAIRPLGYMLELLQRGARKYSMPDQLAPHFRDVRDHTIRATEHLDSLRSALQNALTVQATIVGQDQNDAMKKQSSWAALAVVPTIIAGIYGMNFEIMPELHWPFGYPMALCLMLVVDVVLWRQFRKRDWL